MSTGRQANGLQKDHAQDGSTVNNLHAQITKQQVKTSNSRLYPDVLSKTKCPLLKTRHYFIQIQKNVTDSPNVFYDEEITRKTIKKQVEMQFSNEETLWK